MNAHGEVITTTETARYRYFVTLTGRGRWGMDSPQIGPAIVEVVIYTHESDLRPQITPTFRCFVGGEEANTGFGGPASHFDPAAEIPPVFGELWTGTTRDYGEPETPAQCQWFALCDRVATTLVSHPVLGDVPACSRCKDRYRHAVGG